MTNKKSIQTDPPIHYKKLTKLESGNILDKLVEKESLIEIWRKGDVEEVIEVYAESFDYETGLLYLDQKGKGHNIKDFFGKRVFIKAVYYRVNYFAYTTLRYSKKSDLLYLQGFQTFYSCQLRKDLRVKTGPGFKVKCMIDIGMYKVIDISIGGIKIFLPERKRGEYLSGTIIPSIELIIDGDLFSIFDSRAVRQQDGMDPISGLPCAIFAIKFGKLKREVETVLFRKLNSIVFFRNKR